jgi:hypothetical protein
MRVLKLALIALLAIGLVTTTSAVIRLENYRYANFVGMCTDFDIKNPAERIRREDCLHKSQTRSSWMWHILYGLELL